MSESQTSAIELPSQFAQVQLSALKELVDHQHEGGATVQFDGSALERIDGAAVQFLLSVSKAQASEQAPLVINANEVLLSALDDMGMVEKIIAVAAE